MGKIQKHHTRVLLYTFENYFPAIGGDIEVLNVKAGWKMGELLRIARLQVDAPQILMLDLSLEHNNRVPAGQNHNMSGPSRQGQRS